MQKAYPIINGQPSMAQVGSFLQTIQRLRQVEDLPDWANLPNLFVSGRSSRRIPSGAVDVVAGDKLGDVVYALDGSYQYTLVSVSGVNTWARVALDVAW